MKVILHKAHTRGHAHNDWLDSWHTFSFASYYDPNRMNFGALRVLNDDTVAPGRGFGMHPHDNMEIITIPLQGELEHEDNMGNRQVIGRGDVQAMSAGTGVVHSEKNKNFDEQVKFLQIWVYPNQRNTPPHYDQINFAGEDRHNRLLTIVSPAGAEEGVNIYQNAWFSLGKLDKNVLLTYQLKLPQNGVYAFVLAGNVTINEVALNERDGLGIWETETLNIKADSDAELLLMEVPM